MVLYTLVLLIGWGTALNGRGLASEPAAPPNSGEVNGCVACHTDVKKLIRLSWEVEKVRGKPKTSALTEGEG